MAVAFFVVSLWLVEIPNTELVKPQFKESCGTIIEDIDIYESFMCRYYYPLYLFRRTLYAVVIIVLIDYPMVQLLLIPAFLLFPVCVPHFEPKKKIDIVIFGSLQTI